MSALRTLSARPELRALAWLLLAALLVALATAIPAAAALLALAGALAVIGLSLRPAPKRRTARPARPSSQTAGKPGPTLRLTLPDGETVHARQVPLPGASEHTLLLTRDGYVVVDSTGSVVYRI